MTEELTELIRPVRCHICGKPMFYSGDERHELEVRVLVETLHTTDEFYAHIKCWNERMDLQ